MERFDSIYYINLKHREDRREHIHAELVRVGADITKVQRIEAIHMPYFGIYGCGKSHILALETFINSGVGENCLILEDDFMFEENAIERIRAFFDHMGNEYDVFMLAANVLEDRGYIHNRDNLQIRKILVGQTLSGYCVNRKYAPKLLQNFKEGISMLEILGYGEHEYCVDVHVQKLQRDDRWYYTVPKIGRQIESLSDIERKVTNYNC